MKGKKAIRVALDVALTLMIVFEMLIQFTGEFLHEVIGFVFFATIIAHILLSMSWVKSTARVAKSGKLTARMRCGRLCTPFRRTRSAGLWSCTSRCTGRFLRTLSRFRTTHPVVVPSALV